MGTYFTFLIVFVAVDLMSVGLFREVGTRSKCMIDDHWYSLIRVSEGQCQTRLQDFLGGRFLGRGVLSCSDALDPIFLLYAS